MNQYNDLMSNEELLALPATELARLVNNAFKTYDSLLTLSRSPLAHSPLVLPALVLDDQFPTSDDRGRALRLLLRWAVSRLAPIPPTYPMGTLRPFDDPTWSNPLWWSYNVLRHRYIEPLTPDDWDDLGERGHLGALLSLTGIADTDRFYGVRQEGVTAVAQLLHEQLHYPQHIPTLQRLAIDDIMTGLYSQAPLLTLLGTAATCRTPFARTLLEEMLAAENNDDLLTTVLDTALSHRLLYMGDGDTRLWMSSPLQSYFRKQQPASLFRLRHQMAAHYYAEEEQPLEAAWHWQQAGNAPRAAQLLLEQAAMLMGEWQSKELAEALAPFTARQLEGDVWFQVVRLRVDVHRRLGERARALELCRTALRAAQTSEQQAQIYHRMGKLYEDANQRRALDYYQQALDRLEPHQNAHGRAELLTDKAWIHIHRQEWLLAEADLQQALAHLQPSAGRLMAAVHNAFASLYRQQKRYDLALRYARQLCAWREQSGDKQLVAEAHCNLALIYAEVQETDAAVATYHEALQIFRALHHQEGVGNTLLNMGVALHHAGRLEEAIAYYEESLPIWEQFGIPLGQSQAYYNLAEAYTGQGEMERASRFWGLGYRLSEQMGLSGELVWYEQLLAEYPALQTAASGAEELATVLLPLSTSPPQLIDHSLQALQLAQSHGRVTNRALQDACQVSKPTATRKLAELVQKGYLQKLGKGRAVQYSLTTAGKHELAMQMGKKR